MAFLVCFLGLFFCSFFYYYFFLDRQFKAGVPVTNYKQTNRLLYCSDRCDDDDNGNGGE